MEEEDNLKVKEIDEVDGCMTNGARLVSIVPLDDSSTTEVEDPRLVEDEEKQESARKA